MKEAVLVLLLLVGQALWAGEPLRVIFDTDIGNDVDDAIALAMLHALETRGEARILAVTITKDNAWAAPFVDIVNTFYGRPNIPIGVVRNGKTPEDSPMLRVPCERKRPDGSRVYRRRLESGADAPEAVSLLRRVLAAQPDSSVTFIQVGFSTNLARLLDSPADGSSKLGGRELVARKARLLVMMAGEFPTGDPEYNVKTDIPSARKVFTSWPTEIVSSGFRVGQQILFPASSIERDFSYVAEHPIAEAYRLYEKMPYNRPSWDPTATLYAVRPNSGYFGLSPRGTITVDDEGRTHFTPSANGTRRYLILEETQRKRVLDAIVDLARQRPGE